MTIYDQEYLAELALEQQNMQGVNDPAAGGQVATPQPPVDQSEEVLEKVQEQPEAVSDKDYNFRALREELAQIKEDRDRLRGDFEDLRRNQVQRQPEPPRKRAIDDINSDDLVTGAQLKQAMAEREAEYELQLGELRVKAQYSDYDEVTSKYGVPLIEKEPDLAQGFLASNNKAAYLYKLGKMAMLADKPAPEPVYQAPPPSPNRDAQRIVENMKKPGTLSNSVGGSGQLSKLDYIAGMSDADFHALMTKNLEQV
jgi:hypothetical protein